jgi:hypothetical protein
VNFEPKEDVFDLVALAIDGGIERGRLLRNRLIATARKASLSKPLLPTKCMPARVGSSAREAV